MNTNYTEIMDKISQAIRERLNAQAVYADPITVDGKTIIPVAKISFGFGAGGGRGRGPARRRHTEQPEEKAPEVEGEGEGGGGGGGGIARPMGYIEITEKGTRWVPVSPPPAEMALRGALIVGILSFGKPKTFLGRLLLVLIGQALVNRLTQPNLPPLPEGLRFRRPSPKTAT